MKKTIVLSLIILFFYGCDQKKSSELEYDKLYLNNIKERVATLDKLGEWEYSPNKQDSIWNQTDATYNINLIETVFKELEPIERKWDSLTFLSKKHDTIPLPSEKAMKFLESHLKRKLSIMEWKFKLEKAVERGLYTRDGKKLE